MPTVSRETSLPSDLYRSSFNSILVTSVSTFLKAHLCSHRGSIDDRIPEYESQDAQDGLVLTVDIIIMSSY